MTPALAYTIIGGITATAAAIIGYLAHMLIKGAEKRLDRHSLILRDVADKINKHDVRDAELAERVTGIEGRLGRMETAMERVEGKVDRIESKIDEKIAHVEAKIDEKIDRVEAKIESKIDRTDAKIDRILERLAVAPPAQQE